MTQREDPRRSEPTNDELHALWRKIEHVRFAMLTSHDAEGALQSRPVTTEQVEASGQVWFFVATDGEIARELARDGAVMLTYADPGDNLFVALRGTGELVRDAAKVKSLWNVMAQAWFPGGPDDPRLGLLRVSVQHGEYWDAAGRVVPFLSMLKAALTHSEPKHVGEHREFGG